MSVVIKHVDLLLAGIDAMEKAMGLPSQYSDIAVDLIAFEFNGDGDIENIFKRAQKMNCELLKMFTIYSQFIH